MKLDADFLTSTAGQAILLGVALVLGAGFVAWQHYRRQPVLLPASGTTTPPAMPQVFVRQGARVTEPPPPSVPANTNARAQAASTPAAKLVPPVTPLTLFVATAAAAKNLRPAAPYGRLIPCETVTTLESNRLDTPVIGLVTEDVWHDGRLVIPRGAEVHGKAALDRTRERIAVAGRWVIVWRTQDANNGTELAVQGLALDCETQANGWGEHDGSAGLRGTVVKTQNDRELKLFAATFLGAATAALQDTRASAGPYGETNLPAATVRNATLAGFGAILREQAQQLRDAIARDGFYLRVPAGKRFYLYVTEALDLAQAKPLHP